METHEWNQEVWQAAGARHHLRVDSATAAHRSRRREGRADPVEDFLFTYYAHRPAQLRRWHPGAGVLLRGAAGMPRASWRFYATRADERADGVALGLAAFVSCATASPCLVGNDYRFPNSARPESVSSGACS